MEHFGLEESNVLTAPAIKEDVGEDKGELTKEESAAPAGYLAIDRADIQFAVKEGLLWDVEDRRG